MTETSSIEQIKNKVKKHSISPFTAQDIKCVKSGKNTSVIINDKFNVTDTKALMNALGAKTSLTNRIFAKPEENWAAFQTALNSIDKSHRFAAITIGNKVVSLTNGNKIEEETQLNYDERIDQLMNTISDSDRLDFHTANFNDLTCEVDINAKRSDQIDCGLGDLWQFGSTASLGAMNQKFSQFFLRLICTNGMTTRENVAHRVASMTKDVGKQFMRFAEGSSGEENIMARVAKMKKNRASLYELRSVAQCLNAANIKEFMPEYTQAREDFDARGFSIEDMSAKRSRYVFTDENLYDVFNKATALATHNRDAIGPAAVVGLNKVASDIFVNGPTLEFDVLDIYSKR